MIIRSQAHRRTLEHPELPPTAVRRVFGPPARRAFLRAGRHARPAHLTCLCKALSYLEAGHWLASEYAKPEIVNDDKIAFFDVVRNKVVGRAPLYLEFGVFEGR